MNQCRPTVTWHRAFAALQRQVAHAIDIMAVSAHMDLAEEAGDLGRAEAYWNEAWELLQDFGREYPTARLPTSWVDNQPGLADLLAEAQERVIAEEARKPVEVDAVLAQLRLQELLAAGDWGALGLISPEELVSKLTENGTAEVSCHCLTADEDGVWLTNDYGIDCMLWEQFTEREATDFLTSLVQGASYGPQPV